jgi:hypothetical protein
VDTLPLYLLKLRSHGSGSGINGSYTIPYLTQGLNETWRKE